MLHRKHLVTALTFVFLNMMVCAPAAFADTNTTDTPITDTIMNCSGTPILITGTLHTVMSFSTNPNGMVHFVNDFNVHGSGVDTTTGVNYVYNENIHSENNLRGNAQEQFMGTKVKLISQGKTPNLTDRMTLHVVTDSNGVPKVTIFKQEMSCN